MNSYQAGDLRLPETDITPPFRLNIGTHSEDYWHCEAVLRWLPGKRLVMRIQQNGQRRLGKLFFSARDYHRELRGHHALSARQITTPAILDHYPLPQGAGSIVLYEYIEGPTLEKLNSRGAIEANSPALLQTIGTIADMHRQGLRQVDIHLGNFLYHEARIYVVDSAAIAAHRAPLRAKLARENLGDLLAQFEPDHIDDLKRVWRHYQDSWPEVNWPPAQLAPAIQKMRRLRWRHYRRKLTRSCSEFGSRKNRKRFEVWRRDRGSDELQAALKNPDTLMDSGEFLKRGNTATVAKVTVDGRSVIIKRYNVKNWRHRLSRCWRPSRGWRSWHNAHYLLFSGLLTPQPLAMIEERCGPLRGRAFFICDYAPGEDLKNWLCTADPDHASQALEEFAQILQRYYRARISHGDMKADNFIATGFGVTIIDLDPMTHHRRQAALERALREDIRRFLENFSGPEREIITGRLLALLPQALRP